MFDHHSGKPGSSDLVQVLGWFSIALGASELLAPRPLRKSVGMSRAAGSLIPLYGLREIATGFGLLKSSRPEPWIWARFAGDILDLVTLSPELRRDNPKRVAACAGMAFLATAALVDFLSARKIERDGADRGARQKPSSNMRGTLDFPGDVASSDLP